MKTDSTSISTSISDPLKERALQLGLHGLVARWAEFHSEPWLEPLVSLEEDARKRRSLERRIKMAHLPRFKTMADFDWTWPKKMDREAVEELFALDFLQTASNVVLMGPNAVGKSMISQNLAYQAVLRGHTAYFVSASDMLNDLARPNTGLALQRRLHRYLTPQLLVIDEVGYLSYDTRHADLLFEIVTRRYEKNSIVLTTNKPFAEWNQVFPNAACVVTIVDRLVHHAEIIAIEGDSFRNHEAKQRNAQKAKARLEKRKNRPHPSSNANATSEAS